MNALGGEGGSNRPLPSDPECAACLGGQGDSPQQNHGGGAGRGFETGSYMALSSPTSQPLVIDGVSYPSDPLEVKKVAIPSRAGW